MKLDLTISAIIVHNAKVLVLFHTKLQKWLFPGGHIEPNETPDDAVIREVMEETGLDIIFLHTSPPANASDEKQHLHIPFWANVHNVGDHDHYCSFYLCTPVDAKKAHAAEGQEIRWVTAAELETLNAPDSIKAMARWALMQHRMRH